MVGVRLSTRRGKIIKTCDLLLTRTVSGQGSAIDLGTVGELRPGFADIPTDQRADHSSPVGPSLLRDLTETLPKIIGHADRLAWRSASWHESRVSRRSKGCAVAGVATP